MIIYHIICKKESRPNGIQTPSSEERKAILQEGALGQTAPLGNTLHDISETQQGFSVLNACPQKRQAPCIFYTPKEIYQIQLVYSKDHRAVIPFHLENICIFSLELC